MSPSLRAGNGPTGHSSIGKALRKLNASSCGLPVRRTERHSLSTIQSAQTGFLHNERQFEADFFRAVEQNFWSLAKQSHKMNANHHPDFSRDIAVDRRLE